MLAFHALPLPTPAEVKRVAARMHGRLARLCAKHGVAGVAQRRKYESSMQHGCKKVELRVALCRDNEPHSCRRVPWGAHATELRVSATSDTFRAHASQASRPQPRVRLRCPSSPKGHGSERQHVVRDSARARLRRLPSLPDDVRETVLRARRRVRAERVSPPSASRRRDQCVHRRERLALLAYAARVADRHRARGLRARRHRALWGRPPRG